MDESTRILLRDYIKNFAFPFMSIGMHLAICSAISHRCKNIREWFTKELFDFSFVDCLGGFLLRLFMTIIGLLFTPGVIVCFFFRWLFLLPIKRGGKDNE